MPNGKRGDDEVTDIVMHKETVFGSPIDDVVREIWSLGGADELRKRIIARYGYPSESLLQELRALRDELKARGQASLSSGLG